MRCNKNAQQDTKAPTIRSCPSIQSYLSYAFASLCTFNLFFLMFFFFHPYRPKCCPSCAGALQSPNPGAGQPESWTQSLYGLSSHSGPCQSGRGTRSVPSFGVPGWVRILCRTLPSTPTTTTTTAWSTHGGEPAFTPPPEKQKLGLLSRPGLSGSRYAPLWGPGGRPQGQQRPELPLGRSTQVVFKVQGLSLLWVWEPGCQEDPSPFESVRRLAVQQCLRPD